MLNLIKSSGVLEKLSIHVVKRQGYSIAECWWWGFILRIKVFYKFLLRFLKIQEVLKVLSSSLSSLSMFADVTKKLTDNDYPQKKNLSFSLNKYKKKLFFYHVTLKHLHSNNVTICSFYIINLNPEILFIIFFISW